VKEWEHSPVLIEEVLEALQVRADGIYIDATFGRGGHAQAILGHLGPSGQLLAIDCDPQAVAAARIRFGGDARFTIVRGRFSMLAQHSSSWRIKGDQKTDQTLSLVRNHLCRFSKNF